MPSVIDQQPFNEYAGNGVTTLFAYEFQILAAADMVVRVDGVTIPASSYTLTGVGAQTGGTVEFSTAPASGATVLLAREMTLERDTDYQEQGDLLADTVNNDFNRLWLAFQEFYSGGRGVPTALRVPLGESIDPLPVAADREGYLLGFAGGSWVLVPGQSGTATSLALDLANATNATKGDYLIGVKQPLPGAVARTQHDKNSETLSITDFSGADITGASASDAAMAAALAAAALLTVGGKGCTITIPNGVITLNNQVVMPGRVKIRGAGSRSTIINSNYAGPAFLLAGVESCEIGHLRIGLGTSPLAAGLSITTPDNVDSRKHKFPDLEIAAPSLISGQIGVSMVTSGTGIITECHVDGLTFDQIDRPIYVRGAEGNFFRDITVDNFGAVARSAIDSVGLVNTYTGRIAGSPAAGSVGYTEAGLRNVFDLIVDIGAASTAVNLAANAATIGRLQRPELLTPIGIVGVSNNVDDSENTIVKRSCSLGTAASAANFSLSAGWGSTATVTAVTGKDQCIRFVINSSGVGQAANPTVNFVFADGAWGTSTPMPQVTRDGGDQPTVCSVGSSGTAAGWGFVFAGTPAAGQNYAFVVSVR